MEKHTIDFDAEYQPQIEQKKRVMMKKKRKVRVKRRFIVFLLLIFFAALVLFALKAPFFDVAKVELTWNGESREYDDAMRGMTGIHEGENIFCVDMDDAEEKLLANPVIAEASVHRVFPNRIRIEVTEAVPIAYLDYYGKFLLIDGVGKIITVTENSEDERLKSLTQIAGIEVVSGEAGNAIAASEDVRANKLYDCLEIMKELGIMGKVNYIDFSDLSDIKIDYENRVFMLLGSYEKLEYKLRFSKNVIDESISAYEKALFNFRGENLVVGPREEPGEPEEMIETEEPEDVEETTQTDEETTVTDDAETVNEDETVSD